MKISFDFDDTLTEKKIQNFVKELIRLNHEVWITSCRTDNQHGQPEWNDDLFKCAKQLQIPKEHIQLTNGADKWHYLKDFNLHFDDDLDEVKLIKKNLKNCEAIFVCDFLKNIL